jgi:hypothetical protein
LRRDPTKAQSETNQIPNEVFASEALVAANYKKADLNTIAQNCDENQKAKLLAVLE